MACTQKDIDDNAKEAQKLGYQFGAHNILILDRKKSDDGTWSITFTIYGDESGVKYTEQWGNTEVMWAPCPSEVAPGSTPSKIGDPPNVDTKGLLYFSKKFLDAHKLSARPKWPLELGADLLPLETLQIFPHSFVLKGLESLSDQSTTPG